MLPLAPPSSYHRARRSDTPRSKGFGKLLSLTIAGREVSINFFPFYLRVGYKGTFFALLFSTFKGSSWPWHPWRRDIYSTLGGSYTVRRDLQTEKSWEARDNRGEERSWSNSHYTRSLVFFNKRVKYFVKAFAEHVINTDTSFYLVSLDIIRIEWRVS